MLTDTLAKMRELTSRMADCDQADDGSLYLMAMDLDTLAEQAEREAAEVFERLRLIRDGLMWLTSQED